MLTKLKLPTFYPHFIHLHSPSSLHPKLHSFPAIFPPFPAKKTTLLTTHSFTYGPTLSKGTHPLENQPQQQPDIFDETQFTRVFEISALRVPYDRCCELERRIRGHLLNWPRIPNIGRVIGDEFDVGFGHLLRKEGDFDVGSVENVFDEGLSSGVLYREKLASEFNVKGFLKFRNLAKISRPSRRKKRKEGKNDGDGGGGGGSWRKRSMVVEVLDDGGDDVSGLLGEGFKGRKWKGSTRLLLLDERYVGREVDELPQAVKAALFEGSNEGSDTSFELVRCNLTLFYDYWPMAEVLEALLPKDMIVPSAFETVGHIAHLNLKDEHLPYKKLIAKVVLDKNKPKIKTVVNKVEAISNDYRTMELEVLAGNHSLVTTIVENGMRFQLDLATVYWNSRLATERQRLLSCFTSDDVLCDVFAGVGPIAISAAKKVKRVYANDLNPNAVDYLQRNCFLNKLDRKIEVYNMDARRFIDVIFSSDRAYSVTQVVMNLPNNANEFLDAFRGIFRDKPKDKKLKFPTIHVYGFSRADDPEFDFHERIRVGLAEAAVSVEMRRVRIVAPGKWMLCASFVLPEKVAFAEKYVQCK